MTGCDRHPPPRAPIGNRDSFRRHFENLPIPGYLWQRCGEDFRFAAHNGAALRLAQTRVAQLVGVLAWDLFREQPQIAHAIHRCAGGERTFSQETDLRMTSGAVRRMVMTYVPIGRDILVVHAEDVTDRRVVEDALGRTELRFRALFEAHPDVVFRMDIEGNYLDMHIPEDTTLPLPTAEIRGRNIADLFGPDARAQHRHYATQAVANGVVQTLEYEVRVDGRSVLVESRISRSGDDEVVVIVRDITARSDLEEALVEARQADRRCCARDVQRELTRLNAGLASLRTAGHLQLSSPTLHDGGYLEQEISALEAVTADLSALVTSFDPLPGQVSVAAALAELSARMQRRLGVVCGLTCAPILPAMFEEAPDLYRIAEEATVNAVEHGRARQVELLCSIVGGQLVLSIVDDGSEFRLSASNDAALAFRVMRHLARRLKGTLTRSLRSDGGTVVTCTCPIAVQNQA